ncbi:MAG: multicopper oxidase family protein [Pseudomonadota bacterium]|nr:multicopper oxidase family protein [Pseudomonadota bacterium]
MPLTRRALLGGGIGAVLSLPARAAPDGAFTLEAGPQGFNGATPGPLLRLAAGQAAKLRFINGLDRPASLALPGLRFDGGFAGLTGAEAKPGEARDIAFPGGEPGFHLYTSERLFGPVAIDEATPPAVDLDAIVVFSGADAATLRVNADPAPLTLHAPPRGRVRLRLANAAPDLTITLRGEGAALHIVAIDGQPSEMFEPRAGEFPLSPSARFELMFDLPEGGVTFTLRGEPDRPALKFLPRGDAVAARPPIAPLPVNPRLPVEIALEKALRVRATLAATHAGYAINGAAGAPWAPKPLFKAARGQPVALSLVNQTNAAQTLRLEGHVARQLHGLDDGWDPYWRDALSVAPGQTLHAAFVADAPGKWPLASASPERRARGMQAWYLVT